MKQQTLTGLEKYAKTTRRAQFLADMDKIISCPELAAAVQTVYPKISEHGGRPPIAPEVAAALTNLYMVRELRVFPFIGSQPIAEVSAPQILSLLRRVEITGRHETARRVKTAIGGVMRYAVACGLASSDPTTSLRGALVVGAKETLPSSPSPKNLVNWCAWCGAMQVNRRPRPH